jgi:protein-tyrosine-phosphatase
MRRAIRERSILFLCEDNACLSQIAEAMAKRLSPPKIRIFSAGVKPSTIPAHVYKVMQELGISLSGQSSKGMDQVPLNEIDLVVSFDDADKKCGTPAQGQGRALVGPKPGGNKKRRRHLCPTSARWGQKSTSVSALFLDYWRNIA